MHRGGHQASKKVLSTSCQLGGFSYRSQWRQASRDCGCCNRAKSYLFLQPVAARGVNTRDTNRRRVSATTMPSAQRLRVPNIQKVLYTEITSQWSVFQKDFKKHWELLQAGTDDSDNGVARASIEHTRGDPPCGGRAGRGHGGDWSQRLHWVRKHQEQYRTLTGKKHNSCNLNFTLL